jgi:hypothetical protein
MESDIILEGFLETESKYGLRYMRVVGDGDSSVFEKIRDPQTAYLDLELHATISLYQSQLLRMLAEISQDNS